MGRIEITAESEKRPRKDWLRLLPGLLISTISLAIVLYFVDLGELWSALQLADYRLVGAAILLSLVWLGVRGIAWYTLLQEKATYSKVFLTLNQGYLLNNILPFRLGEVGRAFLMGRKANLDFWQVMSSILIERAIDMALAAGLLMSTLPFVVGATWARPAALGVGAFVLAGLGLLYLLARNGETAVLLFDKAGSRWTFLNRFGSKRFPAFISGLAVLTDGTRFLRAIGWMVLDWSIAIVQFYVLLLAFFPNAKFLWAAFALGTAALGIAAPSSPGALGVFELALVGSLSLFGLNPSVALAYAIVAHAMNYATTGVLGTYALMKDGETLTGLYARARRIGE